MYVHIYIYIYVYVYTHMCYSIIIVYCISCMHIYGYMTLATE